MALFFPLRSREDSASAVTTARSAPQNADTVTAAEGSRIILEGVVTENDTYSDTASGTVSLTLADGASSTVRLTVCEGHGQYAGNTAEWELTCRAAREN